VFGINPFLVRKVLTTRTPPPRPPLRGPGRRLLALPLPPELQRQNPSIPLLLRGDADAEDDERQSGFRAGA
jgi:hypothetical protein